MAAEGRGPVESGRVHVDEVHVVQALADLATIALLQERALTHAETLTEQLEGALNSRVVIEQAKGALAQINGITPSDAFQLLRQEARANRRRLVDVAGDVTENANRA